MTTLPPLSIDEFGSFFEAVHGHEPFPWQARLARQVASSGWPNLLDLPTGSGKTAVLDVALFALALDAGNDLRKAARRFIYVVDRRTVVDQAYERSGQIRRALETGDRDVVQRVRARLESFTGGRSALTTALLRGGIARDDSWAESPDQPLIAVSTVDQVGSRLLFRGYGISDAMKPVHAGLLGSDVLYLLDEVHLSQPFCETLRAVAGRYRFWAQAPVPSPFDVVEMSATPGRSEPGAFALDEADREHPVLASRLDASKPAELATSAAGAFVKEIQKRTLAMLNQPGVTVAVVVNRVNSAREIHDRLSVSAPPGTSVHLLTGRMRPADRAVLEQGLLPRIRAGRVRDEQQAPLIVVSTQSIEAGADFDFDALVTECASLDALRQRFGRLDRLGALGGTARAVIVARTDTLQDDPVYGDAIGRTLEWLQGVAVGGRVDFGNSVMAVPSDAEAQSLLAPRQHAPVLLPSHLDAWVQTSPSAEADPDVALWLHGPERGVADVQFVWRTDLSAELLVAAVSDSPSAASAAALVLAKVDSLPPMSGEAMSVPFVAAKRWLRGEAESAVFDVEGAGESDADSGPKKPRSAGRPALVWQGEQSRVVLPGAVRPGQTLVVPAAYGGIANGNWAPSSDSPVIDIAEMVGWRQRRRPTLRLLPEVVAALTGHSAVPAPASDDTEDLDDRGVVTNWLNALDLDKLAGDERELIAWLRADKRLRVLRLPYTNDDRTGRQYFVVSGRSRSRAGGDDGTGASSTDGAASCFADVEVTLASHLAGVSARAVEFAEHAGLAASLVSDLRLAARWHDAGKADVRFQRWLYGGSAFKALTQSEPLAKGTIRFVGASAARLARERAGYPAGGRHELTSLALMQAAGADLPSRAGDWDLVRYLVAVHHGHCRPLAPWVPDPQPVDVTTSVDGLPSTTSSDHRYHALDSGVAALFWNMVRRYGWWGLAWLEAVLRLADHTESRREASGKDDKRHD